MNIKDLEGNGPWPYFNEISQHSFVNAEKNHESKMFKGRKKQK